MQKLTIIVSGMIAGDPGQGGATWAVLQYVLGFRRLGHEVYLIEPIARPKESGDDWRLATSESAAYFGKVVAAFSLEASSALLLAGTRETVGLTYNELTSAAKRTSVLFNISGMLEDRALIGAIPTRVYLDLDPAFIQLWQHEYHIDMRFNAHTHFVTVGLAIGLACCPVPTCDREWVSTLQPIVLAEWPMAEQIERNALTTVGNWRGYGSVEFEGNFYGQKAHSLRSFMQLPRLTSERFALALSIHPEETKDLEALRENGWTLVDPQEVANTPDRYRSFIQGSKAEFGLAKSGYVASRCGWFSDRSVCYLASGRPVIAQETGFSGFLPVGEGLLAFGTTDDVLAAIAELAGDYSRHARAARSIAEEYFDSDKVLSRLLRITNQQT
jgi:hypothetical protein